MSVLDWIVGIGIVAVIFWFLGASVWVFLTEFLPEVYRALRYDRRGICPECKQRYQYEVSKPADQMYGPDQITQGVCPNGHRSAVRGNRHFAEW